jgi:hypothetical protein
MNKMGFLRGFLAILFGIILVPILSLTVMMIANPMLIDALINAATTLDFAQIASILYSTVTFDITPTLENSGLTVPLLTLYAAEAPGLIDAIGAAGIGTFLANNLGAMLVWMCVGFFVGAIMSKASKGLLIALGLWIAWFVWNLLFGWIILPMFFGIGVMTLAINILPFIVSAILPLVILIVSGAIGGAVTKTEVF